MIPFIVHVFWKEKQEKAKLSSGKAKSSVKQIKYMNSDKNK